MLKITSLPPFPLHGIMIHVDPSWVTWIHNPFPSLTMFGYSTLLNEIYLYSVGMYWRRFVWLNKQKNSSKQHIKRLSSASRKLLNSPFIQLCYLFMHCTEEYNLVTDGIWCRWIWYRSWIIPILWSTKIHGWKRYPFSNLLLFTLVLPHNWGGKETEGKFIEQIIPPKYQKKYHYSLPMFYRNPMHASWQVTVREETCKLL